MISNQPHFKDITGQTFSRLTAIEYIGKGNWKCLCECGNETVASSYNLRKGIRTGCGCQPKNQLADLTRTHGLSKTVEYRILKNMKRRCYSKTCEDYQWYGAKGIKVCERWLGPDGITNLIADKGHRPTKKHSLERIDNDGDYTPENTYWMLLPDQGRTSSNSKLNGNVNNIRAQFEEWEGPASEFYKHIASQYDVTATAVRYLIKGKSYPNGDVTPPS